MNYEQDYIMRLIHEVIRTLIKLLFHVDIDKKETLEFEEKETETDYQMLLELVDEGKIEAAETRLKELLRPEQKEDFKLALLFYEYLNEKGSDFLEEHGYSAKDISDGIRQTAALYGYEAIAGAMLE